MQMLNEPVDRGEIAVYSSVCFISVRSNPTSLFYSILMNDGTIIIANVSKSYSLVILIDIH